MNRVKKIVGYTTSILGSILLGWICWSDKRQQHGGVIVGPPDTLQSVLVLVSIVAIAVGVLLIRVPTSAVPDIPDDEDRLDPGGEDRSYW